MAKEFSDNVVWNEDAGFNAALLPYATNVGAPAIIPDSVETWKTRGVSKVNHQLSAKFEEIKEEYRKLIEEFRWNDLIYNARYNFEPVIGEVYHLYSRNSGELFLSLIEPKMWKQTHIGSFLIIFSFLYSFLSYGFLHVYATVFSTVC